MSDEILVEKRVAIFNADALAEMSTLGIEIKGGSGRLTARLEIPPESQKDAMRLLRREGFSLVAEKTGAKLNSDTN